MRRGAETLGGLAGAGILWLSLAGAGLAQPADGSANLIVDFTGLKPGAGAVLYQVFDSPAAFGANKGAVREGRAPASAAMVEVAMTGLKPGRYAVRAFYDVNNNGKLDTNMFGIPVEPWGFSNDARGAFGPPKWDEAAVEVKPGDTKIAVSLAGK